MASHAGELSEVSQGSSPSREVSHGSSPSSEVSHGSSSSRNNLLGLCKLCVHLSSTLVKVSTLTCGAKFGFSLAVKVE